jgi:hypothetical protein
MTGVKNNSEEILSTLPEFRRSIKRIVFSSLSFLNSPGNSEIDNWLKYKRNLSKKIHNNLNNFFAGPNFPHIHKKNPWIYDYCLHSVQNLLHTRGIVYRNFASESQLLSLAYFNAVRGFFATQRIFYLITRIILYVLRPTELNLSEGIPTRPFQRFDLTIKFPAHSFNKLKTPRNESKKVFCSFAEYWINSNTDEDCGLISVLEYERPSKTLEANEVITSARLNDESDDIEQIDRAIVALSRKGSIKGSFKRLYRLYCFFNELRNRGNPSDFDYLAWRVEIFFESDYLVKFLRGIGSQIRQIYVLPFESIKLGELKFDEEFSSKLIEYSYSENVVIFPAPKFNALVTDLIAVQTDELNCMDELEPGFFRLQGNAVGFCKAYQLSNSRRYPKSSNAPYPQKYKLESCAVALGYEREGISLEAGSNSVFLFDVPPWGDSSLDSTILGDFISTENIVVSFLRDTIKAARDAGMTAYYKPKYSMKNYGDFPVYSREIEQLRTSGVVTFIDPYSRLIPTELPSLVISFPYTSVNKFFSAFGVRTIYYLPYSDKYSHRDNNVLFGSQELSRYLLDMSILFDSLKLGRS